MITYTDTSALVKLVVNETETAEMQAIVGRATVLACSMLAYVELRAAIAAAIRDRRVSPGDRDLVVLGIDRLWAGVSEVAVTSVLVRRAGDLAERMRLRGYDAIHLASLGELGMPGTVSLACWDADLRTAARTAGYALLPA